jgi:hypothetical protein
MRSRRRVPQSQSALSLFRATAEAARIIDKSQATTYRWIQEFGLTDLLKRPRRNMKDDNGETFSAKRRTPNMKRDI